MYARLLSPEQSDKDATSSACQAILPSTFQPVAYLSEFHAGEDLVQPIIASLGSR